MSRALIRLLQSLHLYGGAAGIYRRLELFLPSGRRRRRGMRDLYRLFVGPGDLCFDVGANVGNRTSLFRELGATVVAIEPQVACVAELERRFRGDPEVIVVGRALGRRPGEAEIMISQASTISSMSPEWVASVGGGRFDAYRWDARQRVQVTTMDALVDEHGRPQFCKIDVEGFESEVLKGLSAPVPALSFEFMPEFQARADECISRLEEIGEWQFNYSVEESGELAVEEWVDGAEIRRRLRVVDRWSFADVYAIAADHPLAATPTS